MIVAELAILAGIALVLVVMLLVERGERRAHEEALRRIRKVQVPR